MVSGRWIVRVRAMMVRKEKGRRLVPAWLRSVGTAIDCDPPVDDKVNGSLGSYRIDLNSTATKASYWDTVD